MGQTSLLSGVRVIDMAGLGGEACGRFLADLGADVVLVEPPTGGGARATPPFHAGQSLYAAVHHANKRSVALDLSAEAGRDQLLSLLARADIWIEDGRSLGALGLDAEAVLARLPHLVVLSISPFGRKGPYKDYRGNDWINLAMGGVLSRSGLPGRPPLMPPAQIAGQATAIQAAWAALLAYWNRQETGHGDVIDFSQFEATAQILDPALGTLGTAVTAQGNQFGRGRPALQLYPIFACADGHIRMVVLSKRQWLGLRAWMGEPEAFHDPKFEQAYERFANADTLYPAIATLVATLTKAEAVAQGQKLGVPVAPVLTPGEVLAAPHFQARGLFREVTLEGGARGLAPSGYLRVNGVRAGYASAGPDIGENTREVLGEAWEPRPSPTQPVSTRRPLEGLRVLDLGVIVMGAEAGRLFADQGAEVIKIESRAYPDGARVGLQNRMTAPFAASQRNKQGLGLNLRSPAGVELFKRLVAVSDIVLSNFKPGTLESLGLGAEVLRAINPRLIVVACSAMGADGPWATWMGYGPLVRCVSGLTSLWRYPDLPGGFGDTVTIYPDHFVARVVDTTTLAALIARRRTGQGVQIECAQAEVIINALSTLFLAESLTPNTARPMGDEGGDDAPWGVFPCAGDDEWCVVTIESDEDFRRLAETIGRADWLERRDLASREGRLAQRHELHDGLRPWTLGHAPREATALLQAVGVAAGFMARVGEYGDDPHLRERGFVRHVPVDGLERPVAMENGPFKAVRIPDPAITPSPLRGEHTRDICRRILGLSDQAVADLVASGALEPAESVAVTV